MQAILVRLEFSRGPADGLVLSEHVFEVQDKLRMPISLAPERSGWTHRARIERDWCSVYRLTSERRACEEDNSTDCFCYEFLGYERAKTKYDGKPVQRESPRWLAGMGKWFSRLPHQIAAWMLEPVDFPLRVVTPLGIVTAEPIDGRKQ